MNDSTCTTSESCACAEPQREQEATTVKVQPQWQSRKGDDGTVLEIALPGVAKEALDLTTGNGFLKLNAKRKASETSRYLRGAVAPGAYELNLRLAPSLDGGNASARFEDGLLTVTLPVAEAAKPRRIEVG